MKEIRKDLWKRHGTVAIYLFTWMLNCYGAFHHPEDFIACLGALLMVLFIYREVSKQLWPLYLIHKAVKQMPVGATAIKIHYYYE